MTPADFRAAREALGLSIADLAAILRVDQSAVYRWEAGEREVPGPARLAMTALTEFPAVRRRFKVGWQDAKGTPADR